MSTEIRSNEFSSQMASGSVPAGASTPKLGSRPSFHRLKAVRLEQGITLRRVAQLLKTDIDVARLEEDEFSDLPLSRLMAWQEALEVPIADLLVDSNGPLSTPVMKRARMVRLMKTVAAILEKTESATVRRLADTLAAQLKEVMPELEGVTPWPTISDRRPMREYGRIIHHSYPSDVQYRDF
jgi:transcriptional regulator with XRE-family HTH domain